MLCSLSLFFAHVFNDPSLALQAFHSVTQVIQNIPLEQITCLSPFLLSSSFWELLYYLWNSSWNNSEISSSSSEIILSRKFYFIYLDRLSKCFESQTIDLQEQFIQSLCSAIPRDDRKTCAFLSTLMVRWFILSCQSPSSSNTDSDRSTISLSLLLMLFDELSFIMGKVSLPDYSKLIQLYQEDIEYQQYQQPNQFSSPSSSSSIEILVQLWNQQFITLSERFPTSSNTVNVNMNVTNLLTDTESDRRLAQLQKRLVLHATSEVVWGECLHRVNEERLNEGMMELFCDVMQNVLFFSGVSSVG